MENGIYKLKHRIKNPCPYTREESWIACATIPPGEEDDFYCGLNEFILVVQDRPIMGRVYQEIILGNGGWGSGFFIGEPPNKDHFPEMSDDAFEDKVLTWFQFMSPDPAPQELLDNLVPAKGQNLEEILLMYGEYPDLDPRLRLDKSFWTSTVFEVMLNLCRENPKVLEEFEGGLRALLIKDANVKFDFTYPDSEKTSSYKSREDKRVELQVEKQWKAFRELDKARRNR